jgi:hypothetical protein
MKELSFEKTGFKNKINKRGQVTIFIILALIIVIGFFIIFLLRHPPETKLFDENNPQAYIESCVREATEDAIELIDMHGGDVEPKGFTLHENIERIYLCYTDEFFARCVNQRPLLVEHIEREITDYIRPRIENCFATLEKGLESRYDIVTSDDLNIVTKLQTKNVVVKIDKDFKMTRDDMSREYNHFEMHMVHPIYNFAEIAMEIVDQEIKYCHFEDVGFMILHPRYDIKYFIYGDSDIVYQIEEIATKQKFTFAVRGCIIPAGL